MRLDYLKFKNVFCYGNIEEYVDFRKPADLWQIIGKNGVGKSSMIRILKLAIYQEADHVLQDEIANQINGNAHIEVGTHSKGHDWVIITKFKPNKIAVYKDGKTEPEDWGGLNDTKKRIREEIIDIPYYIFNNAISLSVNDFKSFLKMTPKDARNIRDRIFGFYIVNEMMQILLPQLSKNLKEIDEVNKLIETISSSITTSTEEYNSLKSKIKDDSEAKKQELSGEIDKLNSQLDSHKETKNKLDREHEELQLCVEYLLNEARKEEVERLKVELKTAQEESTKLGDNVTTVKSELVKLNEDKKAIFYKQTIESIDKLTEKLADNKKIVDELQIKYDGLSTELTELDQLIKDTNKNLETKRLADSLKIDVSNLTNLQNTYKGVMAEILTNNDELTSWDEKNEKIKTAVTKMDLKVQDCEKNLELYKNDICPTCKTDLTKGDHADHKSQYEAELEESKTKLDEYNKIANQTKLKIDAIKEKSTSLNNRKSEVLKSILGIKSKLPSNSDFKSITDEILTNIDKLNDKSIETIDIDAMTKLIDSLVSNLKVDVDITQKTHELTTKQQEFETIKSEFTTKKSEVDKVNSAITTLDKDILKDVNKNDIISKKFDFNTEAEYETKIKEIDTKLESDGKTLKEKDSIVSSLNTKIEILSKDIKSVDYFNKPINDKDFDFKGLTQDNLNTKIDANGKNLNSIIAEIEKTKNEITRININIEELSNDDKIADQLKSVQTIIDKFQGDLDAANEKLKKNNKIVYFLQIVEYILSDEAIKAFILKDIIPSINGEISNILSMLDVPIVVMFDDEFNTHLYRFGKEVSLNTISTGQTKMIDASILLAITKILKTKYNSINVVFYDEVFSSIDNDNRATLLEIFKNVCCDQLGMHTFIINHSYLPSSYFGWVVYIAYKNNFSHMNITTQEEFERQFSDVMGSNKSSYEISELESQISEETHTSIK